LTTIKQVDESLYKSLMETSEPTEVEILKSKSGHPVPKINEVLIHSSYDPIKEAEVFIKSCETIIESQDILLVMGFGFGYHVDALVERLKKDPDKYVFVIEPDIGIFKKALQLRDITSIIDKVTFIVGFTVPRLFSIPGFYKILNAAPNTIGYNPAIKVNEEYFTEFVVRRSSNMKEHLLSEADENEELINIVDRFEAEEEIDLNKIIKSILSNTSPLTQSEKLFLFMGELSG